MRLVREDVVARPCRDRVSFAKRFKASGSSHSPSTTEVESVLAPLCSALPGGLDEEGAGLSWLWTTPPSFIAREFHEHCLG